MAIKPKIVLHSNVPFFPTKKAVGAKERIMLDGMTDKFVSKTLEISGKTKINLP